MVDAAVALVIQIRQCHSSGISYHQDWFHVATQSIEFGETILREAQRMGVYIGRVCVRCVDINRCRHARYA